MDNRPPFLFLPDGTIFIIYKHKRYMIKSNHSRYASAHTLIGPHSSEAMFSDFESVFKDCQIISVPVPKSVERRGPKKKNKIEIFDFLDETFDVDL